MIPFFFFNQGPDLDAIVLPWKDVDLLKPNHFSVSPRSGAWFLCPSVARDESLCYVTKKGSWLSHLAFKWQWIILKLLFSFSQYFSKAFIMFSQNYQLPPCSYYFPHTSHIFHTSQWLVHHLLLVCHPYFPQMKVLTITLFFAGANCVLPTTSNGVLIACHASVWSCSKSYPWVGSLGSLLPPIVTDWVPWFWEEIAYRMFIKKCSLLQYLWKEREGNKQNWALGEVE